MPDLPFSSMCGEKNRSNFERIFGERFFIYNIPLSSIRIRDNNIDPLVVCNTISTEKEIEVGVSSDALIGCIVYEAKQSIRVSLENQLGFKVEEKITTRKVPEVK